MKLKGTMLVVSCAVILAPSAAQAARRDAVTIETRLAGTTAPGASGVARLTLDGGRAVFSVKLRGLEPGPCRLLVGGALEGFLFVEPGGSGEIRFDSRAFENEEARVEDSGSMGLSFDPRGMKVQVARDGAVLLEATFPSRPRAGLR